MMLYRKCICVLKFILLCSFILLCGCTALAKHTGNEIKPYLELVEGDVDYCDGAIPLKLVFSQYYKGKNISGVTLNVKENPTFFRVEVGKYSDQETVMCLIESLLSDVVIGITYGQDECAGFIDSFTLRNLSGIINRKRLNFKHINLHSLKYE